MIACILIRDFMAAAERRAQPELINTPLVFLHYRGKSERVYAASSETEGVEAGMRISQAQVICPDAVLLPANLTRCAASVRELVELLHNYTHLVEVDEHFRGDLRLYLDLGKLKPQDGYRLATAILQSCGDLHFKVSIGIAAGKFTAFAAAYTDRLCLIRPGDEPAFLAPQPITLLPLSKAMQHDFWNYGLERLGQFAAWGKNKVVQAFGNEGLKLHKWANGQDGRTVQPYNLNPSERESHTFEEVMDSRLLLNFTLEWMIRSLAQRLERRAASTQQITLYLQLENKKLIEHVLDLRKPLASEEALWRAISRAVDQLQLDAGINRVELLLELLLPDLPRQLSLFEYAEQQERKLEQDIRRFSRRYDSQHFLKSVENDLNHPQLELRYRFKALDE